MFSPPEENAGKQYALAIVLSILPTIFTVLRFHARYTRKTSYGADDWLIVVALLATYITSVFLVIGTVWGYQGQHMKFTPQGAPIIDDPKYVIFLKMLYAGQLSQILAIGPGKLSVLFFYRRIFRGRTFNIVTWTLIALVTGWIVAFFFANMLECLPITEAFINAPGLGTNPKCIHAIPMYLSQVYSDVILDALILVVPVPLVWKLQMPIKQKIAVSGIFLLGIITTASSCVKMIIFNYVGHRLAEQPDVSYFLTPIVYWPLIEASLQIVCACLPLLRHLFKDFLSATRLTTLNTTKRNHTGYMRSYDSRGPSQATSQIATIDKRFYRSDVESTARSINMEHLPHRDVDLKPSAPIQGILVERAFDSKSESDVECGLQH